MSDTQRQALIDGHQLFRGKDRMQAASGYHEYFGFIKILFVTFFLSFVHFLSKYFNIYFSTFLGFSLFCVFLYSFIDIFNPFVL
jgi:hypothetical protein